MSTKMPPRPTPKAASAPIRVPKMHNVISVASGKGGVGKTWFSITLAETLAKRGARVLLFDADLGLANVDVQLGLTPRRDLGGVLQGRLGLGQAVTPYDDGGFDILAGRSGTGTLAQIPPPKLASLGIDLSGFEPGDISGSLYGSIDVKKMHEPKNITKKFLACAVRLSRPPRDNR